MNASAFMQFHEDTQNCSREDATEHVQAPSPSPPASFAPSASSLPTRASAWSTSQVEISSAVGYLLYPTGNTVQNKRFTCLLQSPYLCSSPAAHVCGWRWQCSSELSPWSRVHRPEAAAAPCAVVTGQSNREAASSCWRKTAAVGAAFWIKFW